MSKNKYSFWIFFFLAVQQNQSLACKCFELGVAVRGGGGHFSWKMSLSPREEAVDAVGELWHTAGRWTAAASAVRWGCSMWERAEEGLGESRDQGGLGRRGLC